MCRNLSKFCQTSNILRIEHHYSYFTVKFCVQSESREQCQNWNPQYWIELFNQARAGYAVLTTKHHEGYTLWDSEFKFEKDVFVGRNIVGELASALKKVNMAHFATPTG